MPLIRLDSPLDKAAGVGDGGGMIIRSVDFETSATGIANCPPSGLPEFPLIGRSNVGKSSLINMLMNRHGLARVSSKPGHTQLINFFVVNKTWRLVDLPGYGFVDGPKHLQDQFAELISDYLPGRGEIRRVFVLLDSRHSPHKIDVAFVNWLQELKVPLALAFTKTDKLKPAQVTKNIEDFMAKFPKWSEPDLSPPPVFRTSAETREGGTDILRFIGQAL